MLKNKFFIENFIFIVNYFYERTISNNDASNTKPN